MVPMCTTGPVPSPFRRPGDNLLGHLTLLAMNLAHGALHRWGLAAAQVGEQDRALDIGCGGGAVVHRLLRATRREVGGVDHSATALVHTRRLCPDAIASGRLRVYETSVEDMPFADGFFDVATAFETVYFWPDLHAGLTEVHRVLRPGGRLVITNEAADRASAGSWADRLQMNVPDGDALREACEASGFNRVEVDQHPRRGWLRVTAQA